jgi:NADH:ubiquinone oxidoreductase subunit H
MRLGWKIFLPITLALVLFISSVMLSFNLLV